MTGWERARAPGARLRALPSRVAARARRIRQERHGHDVVGEYLAQTAFGHGYLLLPATTPPPAHARSWRRHDLGDLACYLPPRTVGAAASAGPVHVLLVGHPVDVDAGLGDGTRIAARIAGAPSTADAVRDSVGLGGRWTLLLHDAADAPGVAPVLTVLPDAWASQPVHWRTDGGLAVASAPVLVPSPDRLDTVRPGHLLEVTDPAGVPRASHRPVPAGRSERPAAPDHAAPDHTAPDHAAPDPDLAAVAEEVRARLTEHVRLLAALGPPALALDASPGSALLLAAFLPHRIPDAFAFTCFDPELGRSPESEDLFAASLLCHRHGLPHRVLCADAPDAESPFVALCRATDPSGAPRTTAHALWRDLPPGTVLLHPAGSEAVLGAGGSVGTRGVEESVRDLIDDGDLAHRVLLPFHEPRLAALVRSVPLPLRSSGEFAAAILAAGAGPVSGR